MHERLAFDGAKGQHFLDFRRFSHLGALRPRRASSRSPDGTPAGGGRGRARVVSSGSVEHSKRRPYPLDSTALISLRYLCQKIYPAFIY